MLQSASRSDLIAIVEDSDVVALGNQLLCQVEADEGVTTTLLRRGAAPASAPAWR
jgi:hypothetical protein